MTSDYPVTILDLPPDARLRAQAFIDEGNYYGWRLIAMSAKPAGEMLQYRLDFDSTTIIFLAQRRICSKPTSQKPRAHIH